VLTWAATAVPTQDVFLVKFDNGLYPNQYLNIYGGTDFAFTWYGSGSQGAVVLAFNGPTTIVVASGPYAGRIWGQSASSDDMEFYTPAQIASPELGITIAICHISSAVLSCSIGPKNIFQDCEGGIELAASANESCDIPLLTAVETS
jgi:hypothetical protein